MSVIGQVRTHLGRAANRLPQQPASNTQRQSASPQQRQQHPRRSLRCAAQPAADVRQRLAETGAVVSDQSVPEGHKGLHGFLYGEGGAEAHDSDNRYNFREVSIHYIVQL